MKGKGLGLAIGFGIAALAVAAAGSGGDSEPAPAPPRRPDEKEAEPDIAPRNVLDRFAAALGSNDPKKMRAEAKKLKAEGWKDLAKQLETAALKREIEIDKEKNPKPPLVNPPTTPIIPVSTGPRVLSEGMRGDDVKAWQQQLVRDGYLTVVPDGIFGPLTRDNTKIWQAERGLKADGIVGPATRAAIGSPPNQSVQGAPSSSTTPAPAPAPTVKPAPATTAPPAMVNAPRLLKSGSQGDDVKAWQVQLTKDGHAVAADGVFGPKTKEATVAWQLERGLSADGVVGPDTRAKIGTKPNTKPEAPNHVTPLTVNPSTWRTMQQGMSGPDVREWQLVLERDGYDVGTPDGIFGPKTKAQTQAWQTAHKLAPDGVVGKGTRGALGPLELIAGEGLGVVDVSRKLPPEVAAVLQAPIENVVPGPIAHHTLARALVEHLRAAPDGHEDRELIERFQRQVGLNATGAYGPATARAIADFGLVPPKPRIWPAKKNLRAKVTYRSALRTLAAKDPARASEWLSASNV